MPPTTLSEKKTTSIETSAELLGGANWYQALELGERLGSLADRSAGPETDEALADRRVARWRSEASFHDEELWQRRLAAEGLDEALLKVLLGERPEALRERTEPPAWLVELARAYSAAEAEPFPWPATTEPELLPFMALAEPLVHAAYGRLLDEARQRISSFPEAPFGAETAAAALVGHLPNYLAPLLNRALVVELQVARMEERLAGASAEERFQDFVGRLRRSRVALEILGRYPVLGRQLVLRVRQWEENSAEFLGHLAFDAPELSKRFAGGGELGRLVEARGAVSDPHRGGRGVLLLSFDSGLRLVYKPRPLAVDRAFQELLAWLEKRGFEPGFRRLEVVDAPDHGWVEFVAAAPCATVEEIRRFYLRQGAYLALLYLLDGTDFHHENLIAAGEHPMLVDLETLFQPPAHGRNSPAGAPLDESVLRAGLLPQRVWGSREHAGVDLSALAARPGQLTPKPVLTSVDRGTDSMHVERRQVEIPLQDSQPRLAGSEVPILDYADDLRQGFHRLYHLLIRRREELSDPTGPLAGFAEAEVRVILRPTASYGNLILESYHPHALGNAVERQILLDRLWGGTRQRPFLECLVPAEIRDLAQGDIALFTTRPASRDLWTSTGERLAGYFEESGLERARRRLDRLSPRDFARQAAAVDDSLEAVRLAGACTRPSYSFRERSEPASRDELLTEARRIGHRLLERAFRNSEEAYWLTLEHREPAGWTIAGAGADLYTGLTGVALALGYLGEATGEADFTEAARQAVRSQKRLLEENPSDPQSIGGFNGWGGVIYALAHLGVLWSDEALLDEAEGYARALPPRVEEDPYFDLVTGSAGCLLSLLALAEVRAADHLLETARACGRRLLDGAVRQERGVGWVMPLAGPRPLAGISHGAAGIVLALLRLWAATGDDRLRRTAEAGLELERGLYSAAERNWPDLRDGASAAGADGSSGDPFMCAWCHGAPGIGLARLAGLPYLDDAAIRAEIDVAVATTLDRGFGGNHCLCHGDLGNLDFLLEAARASGDRALLDRTYRMAGGILDSMARDGWLFGLAGNVETPGLMAGLSGLAYGLARLAEPDRLPSLLVLAPPARKST